MKLYVVRHGETDMGKNQVIADVKEPLNSNGVLQAQSLHNELSKLKIDKIYVSPIQRALDTLAYFNIPDIPTIIEPRIEERNMGSYVGVPFKELDWEAFWNYNSNSKYPDCESMSETYDRVSDFLDELIIKNENVLLVTHGGISRVIYWYINGIPEDGHSDNINENCKIYEYDLKEKPLFVSAKRVGTHFV
ncbi:MAG: histidine phosphatase family protein [Alphaproteobacteria bacterium]|nr:histidine phosphatase family protein [Alphaproteobacteria bacterium]